MKLNEFLDAISKQTGSSSFAMKESKKNSKSKITLTFDDVYFTDSETKNFRAKLFQKLNFKQETQVKRFKFDMKTAYEDGELQHKLVSISFTFFEEPPTPVSDKIFDFVENNLCTWLGIIFLGVSLTCYIDYKYCTIQEVEAFPSVLKAVVFLIFSLFFACQASIQSAENRAKTKCKALQAQCTAQQERISQLERFQTTQLDLNQKIIDTNKQAVSIIDRYSQI